MKKHGLTELETLYLGRFRKGMDENDSGWLCYLAPENRTTSGVVSSLVKKGLIYSTPEDSGDPYNPSVDYWIEVTEKGAKLTFTEEEMKHYEEVMDKAITARGNYA
jgi:hypothetical protein